MEHKIIIAGFGGQGIVLAGSLLANAALIEEKNVAGMVSYGAEVRGGTATATVVISEDEISSPVIDKPTIIIAMNQPSLDKYKDLGGHLVVNTSLAKLDDKKENIVEIPATEIAQKLGNIKVTNLVVLGALLKKVSVVSLESAVKALPEVFKSKPNLVEINKKALKEGFGY